MRRHRKTLSNILTLTTRHVADRVWRWWWCRWLGRRWRVDGSGWSACWLVDRRRVWAVDRRASPAWARPSTHTPQPPWTAGASRPYSRPYRTPPGHNNNSSVLFFSRPRSEGWPHHGRTFSIYLCHSDWLFHGESCPCLDVVHPGRAWVVFLACVHVTLYLALGYLFLQANPLFPHGVTVVC